MVGLLVVFLLGGFSPVLAGDMLPAPSGVSPCGETMSETSSKFV